MKIQSMSKSALSAMAISLAMAFSLPAAHAGAIHDSNLFTTVFPGNDDGSVGPVSIGFTLNFYGNNWNQLYVNNNGNVTFTEALRTYTPYAITSGTLAMLAPFFADVDTRVGNVVTYGAATLSGRNVFGVNWIDVGYYSGHTNLLNSFQLIITDRSDIAVGDFDFEFNYDKIQWETGDASGGSGGFGGTPASAGWTNGVETFYQFPCSLTRGAFEDNGTCPLINGSLNSNTLGQYVFSVRNGQVEQPPTYIPEPASLVLVGLGLAGVVGLRRRKY